MSQQLASEVANRLCRENLLFVRDAMKQCWLNLSRVALSLGRIVR